MMHEVRVVNVACEGVGEDALFAHDLARPHPAGFGLSGAVRHRSTDDASGDHEQAVGHFASPSTTWPAAYCCAVMDCAN
jgi:hypothetical protein